MLDTTSVVVTMTIGMVVAGIATSIPSKDRSKERPWSWAYVLLFVSEGPLLLSLLANISVDLVRWLSVVVAMCLVVWGMWKGWLGLAQTRFSYASQRRRARY